MTVKAVRLQLTTSVIASEWKLNFPTASAFRWWHPMASNGFINVSLQSIAGLLGEESPKLNHNRLGARRRQKENTSLHLISQQFAGWLVGCKSKLTNDPRPETALTHGWTVANFPPYPVPTCSFQGWAIGTSRRNEQIMI